MPSYFVFVFSLFLSRIHRWTKDLGETRRDMKQSYWYYLCISASRILKHCLYCASAVKAKCISRRVQSRDRNNTRGWKWRSPDLLRHHTKLDLDEAKQRLSSQTPLRLPVLDLKGCTTVLQRYWCGMLRVSRFHCFVVPRFCMEIKRACAIYLWDRGYRSTLMSGLGDGEWCRNRPKFNGVRRVRGLVWRYAAILQSMGVYSVFASWIGVPQRLVDWYWGFQVRARIESLLWNIFTLLFVVGKIKGAWILECL